MNTQIPEDRPESTMEPGTAPFAEPSSTAMTEGQYARSHPKGMGRGYWHLTRNAILWRNVRSELTAGGRVLDVGCGPGIVVQYLREKGVDAYGVDLGTPEPELPELAPYLHYSKLADALDPEFRNSVTTLLLMDVLEHLPEPRDLLEALHRDYPNARTVYITVPARMEVWSAWDEFFGHYRRYTKEAMEELVAGSSYTLDRCEYFFHSLYWVMRVVGALTKQRSTRVSSPRFGLAHRALGGLFVAEHLAVKRGGVQSWLNGSSVYAILRR